MVKTKSDKNIYVKIGQGRGKLDYMFKEIRVSEITGQREQNRREPTSGSRRPTTYLAAQN